MIDHFGEIIPQFEFASRIPLIIAECSCFGPECYQSIITNICERSHIVLCKFFWLNSTSEKQDLRRSILNIMERSETVGIVL